MFYLPSTRVLPEGVDGLLRDKSRPGRPPVADGKVGEVIRLTQSEPPHEASHWTVRAMAAACGLAISTAQESQIQALDRTQASLPMKIGRPATRTHDYRRYGTTTLFAALNVLDDTVTGRNMQRHRDQEFIRFLNTIEAAVPAGKVSMPSSTTMRSTPSPRSWRGWPVMRAGLSTSRPHRVPG